MISHALFVALLPRLSWAIPSRVSLCLFRKVKFGEGFSRGGSHVLSMGAPALDPERETCKEKRERLKKEAKAPQTAQEKELRLKLADVEEQLGIKTMRGGHTQSFFHGDPAVHQQLEEEYHSLRKQIAIERTKAVEALNAAKEAVLDTTSWTERILEGGRFDKDTLCASDTKLVSQTTGLMSREDYEKKRKQLEGDAEEEQSAQIELERAREAESKEEAKRLAQKKRKSREERERKRAQAKTLLSFDEDEGWWYVGDKDRY
ncbi:hypothetical protein CYMTET_43761 [Cymbomonas tetramitiformis]|uniref:Uncharacterized protein n=1 Tax=Cymbomonas tetramitiformis TaxID=36881 RepID=A0AAE0EZZ5_9CHLO|nr:hypothetical protein CYMTET_43761 [Cymbomonas tetramitiformis]